MLAEVLLHKCRPLVKSLEKFAMEKSGFFFLRGQSLWAGRSMVAAGMMAGAKSVVLVSLLVRETACDGGSGELHAVPEQGDSGWISEGSVPEEVSGV